MSPPPARGDLSAAVLSVLSEPPTADGSGAQARMAAVTADSRDDAGIALWMLQELHYRGFEGVDEAWEWHPALIGLRVDLERVLETELRRRWADAGGAAPGQVVEALLALLDADDGPSLARHLHHDGTADQARDLLRQRSVYHLKEADPTAWVVPRLGAQTKAALMEIQFDEYGAGDPARLHHHLFANGLAASGLCADYGAYVADALPEVIEQNTAVSMFGLQRRLRGAALGHFAAVESTSSLPSRQLAQGLRRLGLADEMVAYYDEHVEADAVHEQLAVRDVCGALVREEPRLRDDVLFGAWSCLDLEARLATAMLARWQVAA